MRDLARRRRRNLAVLAGCVWTVVWSAAALAADPAQGEKIASSGADGVVACATCHGAKGEGMAAAGFPYLASQGSAYLARQLHDFADGTRTSPVMQPIAKALDAQQIAAVAAYFSQLPAPVDTAVLSEQVQTYPDKDDAGAWLANRGDWDNTIPACIQCHGPGGVGVGEEFPALAGLPASYIVEQLTLWQEEKRAPGPLSLMADIALRMDASQIKAVADYFAALPDSKGSAVENNAHKPEHGGPS